MVTGMRGSLQQPLSIDYDRPMSSIVLDRLRWRYRALRYRYKLERMELRLLLEHLSPGDTALDIGAHKGAYTWWMREAVGPTGQVDAFEPQPALAAALKTLVSARGDHNVHVEHAGLSRRPGTLTLHVPSGGPSPSASFEASDDNAGGDRIEVPVTTIDDWMQSRNHAGVKLIKVDVEGHELAVFAGGERTLSTYRPALLFECEVRHRASGTLQDVFDYLLRLGYEGQAVGRDALLPLDAFDPAIHQQRNGTAPYLNNFWFEADRRD